MVTLKRDDWNNQSRYVWLSRLAAPCLAVFLCLFSIGAVAQTTFDYEDPLEDLRRQLENVQPADTTETPASAAETAAAAASTRISDTARKAESAVQGGIEGLTKSTDPFAERLGLSTNGTLGLLGALLLALGALIAWALFRRRKPPSRRRPDSAIYANSGAGRRKRRTLDSGAHVQRRRKTELNTSEMPNGIEEAQPEALASIEAEEEFALAEAAPEETTIADDPDTWRRPNLDRLKASIRQDWAESKDDELKKSGFESDEAQAFAELFGDEAPSPARVQPAAKAESSAVLDMLDTYDSEPDLLPPDATQETVVAHASKIETPEVTRKVTSSLPTRSEALRRVRALRDSVKTA